MKNIETFDYYIDQELFDYYRFRMMKKQDLYDYFHWIFIIVEYTTFCKIEEIDKFQLN